MRSDPDPVQNMNLGPSLFVRFSPDGRWLASCGTRSVSIRGERAAKPVFTAKLSHAAAAAFAPDSSALVVKTTSGELQRFELGSSWSGPTHRRSGESEGAAPAFSHCGRFLIDAAWDGQLNILDSSTLALTRQRRFDEILLHVLTDAQRECFVVHHAPRAQADDKPPAPDFFTLWKLPLAESPVQVLRPNLAFARLSALSPSGDVLAVVHGAPPTQLSLVDVSTGAVRATVSIDSAGTGGGLSWSTDGRLAVVESNSVSVYAHTLDRLFVLELPYACDVAFAPIGARLAVGSWKKGVVTTASGSGA